MADVDRVREIQTWLLRGLAISRVKSVLADPRHDIPKDVFQEDQWASLAAQLEISLGCLDCRQLGKLIAEIFALYPPDMLADKLLNPLINRLQQSGLATATQLALLHQSFAEKLYTTCSYQRQNAKGPVIVIIKLHYADEDLLSLLLTYGLLIKGYQAEYWAKIPREEWLFLIEKRRPCCLILHSESILRSAELQQIRKLATKAKIPLLFSGKTVCVLRKEEPQSEELCLDENVQQTLVQVERRFPLNHE